MQHADTPSFRHVAEQRLASELFLAGGNSYRRLCGSGQDDDPEDAGRQQTLSGPLLSLQSFDAAEARGRFPAHVKCATTHSIAFRSVRRSLGYPECKPTESLTPNLILQAFRLPQEITFRSGFVLEQKSYAAVLRDRLRLFLQSREAAPSPPHVPTYGAFQRLSSEQFESFAKQVAEHLGYLWASMLDRSKGLPLGHDGYLKLWALSNPRAQADHIMVDEAQDLNPVLLEVLNRLECQIVYVGDANQQIYEWRGAVNAMDQVQTRYRCLLSQSFRFGPEIAAAATIVLRTVGSPALPTL